METIFIILYFIFILFMDIIFGYFIFSFLYDLLKNKLEALSFNKQNDKEKEDYDKEKEIFEDNMVFTTAELEEVERFRERIAALKKDRDGLYDVTDEPITNFTGAEISE